MPIEIHCKKLQGRYFLCMHTLPANHPILVFFPTTFERVDGAPVVRFPLHHINPTANIPLTLAVPQGCYPLISEHFNLLDDEC